MNILRIQRSVFQMNFYLRRCSTLKNSKSFVLSSFEGKIETAQIFPYPKVLTKDQEEILQQTIGPTYKLFQERNNAAKNDELETIPKETMNALKELGAFGLQVPEEYGGIGLNNTQYARLVEIVGSYDLGVGIALGAHQSIGFKGILLFGSKEQKSKYLPSVASGEKFAAFCLTEPTSGSDAQSIQLKAVKSLDGKHYILNGSKVWISNGGIADVFTVFAKTLIKDANGIEKEKITAFIVERDFGGVSHSPPEKKMGIKCSNTAALFFEDCKVPVENILGGEGHGFKVAMQILNNGRFGMAAALSGTMRTCIAKATEFAVQRTQFSDKIAKYGSIQEKLSRMAVKHYITESIAYVVAGNMDRGIPEFQTEAAISKIYASEAAWYCCDEAIQIMGGMGFMKEAGLEKVLRDLRVFRIFEGTSEILRLFLVAQGLLHVGNIMKSRTQAAIGFQEMMNKVGLNKFGDIKSLNKVVHPSLKSSSKKVAFCIHMFGCDVQSLVIKHKKNIINQQFHLKRLSDCAIEIYGMAIALSRASEALNYNDPSASYQAHLATLACSLGSETVHETLSLMKHNSDDFGTMEGISNELCKFGGVIQNNPLGF